MVDTIVEVRSGYHGDIRSSDPLPNAPSTMPAALSYAWSSSGLSLMPQLFLLKSKLVLWAQRGSAAPLCSLTRVGFIWKSFCSKRPSIWLCFEYWIIWLFALPLPFALRIYSLQIVISDTNQKGLWKEGDKYHRYYLLATKLEKSFGFQLREKFPGQNISVNDIINHYLLFPKLTPK